MSIKSQMLKAAANTGKKLGGWETVGAIIPAVTAIGEYNTARSEGNNFAMSAGRAVGEYVIGESMGMGAYFGIGIASSIPKMAISAGENLSAMSRNMNRAAINGPFKSGSFNDTQATYTMRQAGMQMAQASKYNLQQTLMGNEAQYMHL